MPRSFQNGCLVLSLSRRLLPVFSVVGILAGAASAAAPAGGAKAPTSRVRFLSNAIETSRKAPDELRAAVTRIADSGQRHFVMQFSGPVTEAERAKLSAAGVTLQSYLGDNAFFASRSGAIDAGAVTRAASLIDAFGIQVNWKLHPSFLSGNLPSWGVQRKAVAPAGEPSDKPQSSEEALVARDKATTVAAYVMFHPDVPLEPVGVNLALRHGAFVRSKVSGANALVVEMPLESVQLLVGEDEVQWMEPPLPAMAEINAENRVRTGANVVQAAPYSLDGSGVTVLVYDGGLLRTTHVDFQGRAVNGPEPACETLSDHSTHVAGTIGGAGVANANNKGMAPAVSLVGHALNQGNPPGCSLSSGFLYTDPGDMQADYTDAIVNRDAHIANNSIGTNTAPNGFPCDWEGNYGVTDVLIDKIVRGTPGIANGEPFRVVWANGNERGSGRCGTTYRTTAPPACAKNHITVGALNSNDDSLTSFTSWGPADDGRMKPDISAPGCQVGGDNGVTSCFSGSDTAYGVFCGTSMASPTVCGLSALLLQDYRNQFPSRPDFRNSTLKILFAHTAVDLGNAGPDNQFGYGSVRIQPAVDFMRTGNFLEASVTQGQSYNVLVVVNPGDPEFKATLAWDDPPGTPNVNPALVNDLDLVVFDPSNTQRFPWTLDVNNPGNPAVQTQKNSVDNIEQVRVASPAAGIWRIEVRGFNVPQGPQPFSLAASPLLVNCSRQGVISLDRNKYLCTTQAAIRVIDCDLNADDNVVETVSVTINSTTEAGGESVLLTESGPQTADFRGTINLSTTNSSGVLQVAHGDTVTATYVDADDGQGGFNVVRTSTAEVDCQAPIISNVQVTNIGARNATVTFDTNEPATGRVQSGLACNALANLVTGAGSQTSHSILISGLDPNTTYFFDVGATDPAGNSASDDNGGACYSFATPNIPNLYTELFDGGDNDLDNRTVLFVPNGSISFYSACGYPNNAFPTDPAGGTQITSWTGSADDGNSQITLTGGETVKIHGASFGSCFVGTNGYITFTSGETVYTETLAAHFTQARVAALFDDLDPGQGGSVSWKQLSDRLVVTWQNVPEHNVTSSPNSFQIELYFDGRIQITWLTLSATDGLAGLSPGGGLSPDFFEADISGFGSCGPRPPSASGGSFATGMQTPITIALLSSDDGLPGGPLQTIVTTLPNPLNSLKDTGNNHVIVPGDLPYTISGNGNQVTYTPSAGFSGADSFQYKANDGGTPPDGGDSNVATISLQVDPILFLPFVDTFPTTTFDPQKWKLVETATIDTVGIAEPSEPNSARFNGDPDGSDQIQTHLINLSGESAVRLTYSYEQTGGGEAADTGDDLFVEYLDSGGNWQLLQTHLGSGPDMTTYSQVSMLLPAPALHANFKLRFRNTATAGAFDDWFVDDISLTVANAPTASNVAGSVAVNTVLDVALPANDPNGDTLTYVIMSLPTNGLLKDPNGGIIAAVPYSLAANGSHVLYKGAFNYQGTDLFTFKASDGTYDSNVANVNVTVGGPQVIHSFPLNTDPGWTVQGQWAWGPPTGGGSHNFDPVGGFTGPNAYGYNLTGDYPNNLTPTQYLTTTAINCTGATGIQLRFRRWLGIESSTFDHATVDVSNDGTTWTNVWNHSGAALSENAWSLQTYNVGATADNQATVYVRWGMGTTDGSVTYPGWNIDDVEILGLTPQSCPPVTPGDMNGDTEVNGDDIQLLTTALLDPFLVTAAQQCAADVNQDNSITAADAPAMVQVLLTAP